MNRELLPLWRPHPRFLSPLSLPSPSILPIRPKKPSTVIFQPIRATLESSVDEGTATLTAKERRQLRNEKRETYNWREEVEEKLLKKPKKQYKSWMEELNLDNLALPGRQWWIVRVSRAAGMDTAERMAQALVRSFPDVEFKIYAPAVHVKRKLKNGSISVKPKPLYPGCVFLNCIMNREIHDFIRECDGVGGFIGSKVGNTKRQINKPRPVSDNDMEAIFQEVKEEQEKADKAFEEEHPAALESEILDKKSLSLSNKRIGTTKTKRRSRKALEEDLNPLLGSTVRVVSGAFADFTGTVRKLDRKRRLATVGLTLFGKETLADLDLSEIVAEPK